MGATTGWPGGQDKTHRGGNEEAERAGGDGGVEIAAQLDVDRALERQTGAGGQRQGDPRGTVGERRSGCTGASDQRCAAQDGQAAEDAGHAERLRGDAKPAESVDGQRGQHLTGDEQPDGAQRAEAREQQDALVAEAGIDAAPEVLADQLLAPLAPDLYAFQRDELGRTRTELIAALTALTRVLAPDG